MKSRFYITTAIDYVNAEPHLGHAYEKIVTDCLARFHRQLGDETFFLTGTDEHGQKILRAAEAKGEDPQTFTDRLAGKFRETYDELGISYDRFIRTTEKAHEMAVQEWFRRAYKAGDIYPAEYEGLYCVACEGFYQEKDLREGNLCPVHETPVQAIKEKNFFLKLSKYSERLREHIEKNPDFIRPRIRRNEVLGILREGLQDVSISRATLSWGVPVPPEIEGAGDDTIYVWVDALLNYITAIGFPDESYRKWWCRPGPGGEVTTEPNALHIIGKDIIRFHCLIWPVMHWAAGIPLPRSIFVHGFINLGGEKLSKTAGRMVAPEEITERFGVDALRYYVLREVPFGRDGEFSWEQIVERYNTDLANELGNLVSRSCSMLHRYRDGVVPGTFHPGAREQEVRELAAKVSEQVHRAYGDLQPSGALEAAWTLVKRANRYVEENKPWELAKKPDQAELLDTVLVTLLECARLAGLYAWPAIPGKCDELWEGIGMAAGPGEPAETETDRRWEWFAGGEKAPQAGTVLPKIQILFPKIEVPVGPGA
jgi:methionyl-tRNA synthetase